MLIRKSILRTLFFFARGVRGANSCIWAWQIAAREYLMTRTNDRVLKNDQDQGKREWKMETVRKNKGQHAGNERVEQ